MHSRAMCQELILWLIHKTPPSRLQLPSPKSWGNVTWALLCSDTLFWRWSRYVHLGWFDTARQVMKFQINSCYEYKRSQLTVGLCAPRSSITTSIIHGQTPDRKHSESAFDNNAAHNTHHDNTCRSSEWNTQSSLIHIAVCLCWS